jgi:hypothetical protein
MLAQLLLLLLLQVAQSEAAPRHLLLLLLQVVGRAWALARRVQLWEPRALGTAPL